jgi:uncharacterized coiled-coil DUF342 family protein
MTASQSPNKEIAKEVVSIRVIADNAYAEVLSIHPILKKNASSIESLKERLNEFTFLATLEEKLRLLSLSVDTRLSSFYSKLDCFFYEVDSMKKSLEEEKKTVDCLRKEFLSLYESVASFKKTVESSIASYKSLFDQKIEDAKQDDERLRKGLEGMFRSKEDEHNQKNKDLTSKIASTEEKEASLLEEIRKLKVMIRVLENNFATFRNKEKG